MSDSDDTAMLKAIARPPLRACRFPVDDDEGEFEHVFMEWFVDDKRTTYGLDIDEDEIRLTMSVSCKTVRAMTWRRVR